MSKECVCGEVNNVHEQRCHSCGERLPASYTDYRGITVNQVADDGETDTTVKTGKNRKKQSTTA